MRSFVNSRRVFTVIVSVLAALAIWVAVDDSRQLAQRSGADRRPLSLGKFEGSDQVTTDIRSDAKEFVRLAVSNLQDREKAAGYGRIVADYGSFVIVAKNKGIDLMQSGLANQSVETSINLPGTNFEPINSPPSDSLRLGRGATSNGKGYYILQFGGTVKDEWLESLRGVGVEVLQYVPHQAYFVYGESDAIAKVAEHSRVRWIGGYTADQKYSNVLREQLISAKTGTSLRRAVSPIEFTRAGSALFDVSVFARADVDAVADQLRATYSPSMARVSRLPNNFFNVIRVELKLDEVESIAAMPDIFSIDAVVKPMREDERSSQIVAGNYSSVTAVNGPGYNPLAQFGVDGTNVTVAVADDGIGIPGDGGFYITAANAVNGPLRGASTGAFGHGHLNATIIAGSTPYSFTDASGYNYGSGVAPKANVVNIPKLRSGYSGSEADIYNDSVLTPAPNGVHATIINNSWGEGLNGNVYNAYASQYDGFVRDASSGPGIDPISIVFSAGNNGVNGLTQPKMAKNVIAVGNSESLRTEIAGLSANNIDDMDSSSSRGPAADGRIKPDISAPGSGISGGRSGGDTLLGNLDANHRWSSGTSHAAPHIAGMAALFTQFWKTTNFGIVPTPAMVKAAIINSGQDMNGNLSGAGIPNGNEGWGRANLKMMLNTGVDMNYIDSRGITLSDTGQSFPFSGSVDDPNKPVRVTLVWTDPPGTADPALVNNLDLTVTIGGTVYKGNVFSGGISVIGGTADIRNNVENVFLPAGIPAGTSFSVSVTATALNGDGAIGNGDFTDQNYAVVAYNYSVAAASTPYTVSGRVTSPSGRGVALAKIRIVNSQSQVREALTNHFGYFTFADIVGGQNVTVSVTSKHYTFQSQSIAINGNLTGLSIVAATGFP